MGVLRHRPVQHDGWSVILREIEAVPHCWRRGWGSGAHWR